MRYTTRRLAYELNREPTIRELSDVLNWPMEKILFIQRLTELKCVSLDTHLGENDDRTIGDTMVSKELGPFEAARDAQRADLLERFLERLTPRQEIRDHLGVTRERVRKIEEKALPWLGNWVHQRMHDALL